MKIPPTNQEFQSCHACVLFDNKKDANGRDFIKLYVQCTDAYSRQLELSVQLRYAEGDDNERYYEVHAYRHPGVRKISGIKDALGELFIERFMHLSSNYSTLLFNPQSDTRGRNYGFVQLHTDLLDGAVIDRQFIKNL